MHKLPQPVKLWYCGAVLPPRGAAGRPLPPVHPDRRGGARLGRPLARRRADRCCSRELLERAGARAVAAAAVEPRHAGDARASTSTSCARTCARARASCPTRCARGSTTNPLRAFDSDHPGTQAVMAEAPRLLDRLDADDAEHFAEVRALLDDAGLAYEVDPTLVRGLDYYTRTVFEFRVERARRPGGAGRRRALRRPGRAAGRAAHARAWAGPPGIERILLAAGERRAGRARPDVFVAVADGRARARRVRARARAARARACAPRWSRPAAR